MSRLLCLLSFTFVLTSVNASNARVNDGRKTFQLSSYTKSISHSSARDRSMNNEVAYHEFELACIGETATGDWSGDGWDGDGGGDDGGGGGGNWNDNTDQQHESDDGWGDTGGDNEGDGWNADDGGWKTNPDGHNKAANDQTGGLNKVGDFDTNNSYSQLPDDLSVLAGSNTENKTSVYETAIEQGLSEECAAAFANVLADYHPDVKTTCNPFDLTTFKIDQEWVLNNHNKYCGNNPSCDMEQLTADFAEVEAACYCSTLQGTHFGRLLAEIDVFKATYCEETNYESCYFVGWEDTFDEIFDRVFRLGGHDVTKTELDDFCLGCPALMAEHVSQMLSKGHLNYNEWVIGKVAEALLDVTCSKDIVTGEYCLLALEGVELFNDEYVGVELADGFHVFDGDALCGYCTQHVYVTMDWVFAQLESVDEQYVGVAALDPLDALGNYWDYFRDVNATEGEFAPVLDAMCFPSATERPCFELWNDVIDIYPPAILKVGLLDCDFHREVLDPLLGCCYEMFLMDGADFMAKKVDVTGNDAVINTECTTSAGRCESTSYYVEFGWGSSWGDAATDEDFWSCVVSDAQLRENVAAELGIEDYLVKRNYQKFVSPDGTVLATGTDLAMAMYIAYGFSSHESATDYADNVLLGETLRLGNDEFDTGTNNCNGRIQIEWVEVVTEITNSSSDVVPNVLLMLGVVLFNMYSSITSFSFSMPCSATKKSTRFMIASILGVLLVILAAPTGADAAASPVAHICGIDHETTERTCPSVSDWYHFEDDHMYYRVFEKKISFCHCLSCCEQQDASIVCPDSMKELNTHRDQTSCFGDAHTAFHRTINDTSVFGNFNSHCDVTEMNNGLWSTDEPGNSVETIGEGLYSPTVYISEVEDIPESLGFFPLKRSDRAVCVCQHNSEIGTSDIKASQVLEVPDISRAEYEWLYVNLVCFAITIIILLYIAGRFCSVRSTKNCESAQVEFWAAFFNIPCLTISAIGAASQADRNTTITVTPLCYNAEDGGQNLGITCIVLMCVLTFPMLAVVYKRHRAEINERTPIPPKRDPESNPKTTVVPSPADLPLDQLAHMQTMREQEALAESTQIVKVWPARDEDHAPSAPPAQERARAAPAEASSGKSEEGGGRSRFNRAGSF